MFPAKFHGSRVTEAKAPLPVWVPTCDNQTYERASAEGSGAAGQIQRQGEKTIFHLINASGRLVAAHRVYRQLRFFHFLLVLLL